MEGDGNIDTTRQTTDDTMKDDERVDAGESVHKEETREICKFYLEGRCRFGEECNSKHEGKVVVNKKSKKKEVRAEEVEEVEKVKGKKPPMKTAADVINRLQWDPLMPKEYFVVGYLDRFKGIVEENFTTFCWEEDIAAVDNDTLAIPQHRIQYFKYKTEKVWDKASRFDLMFGSTGIKVNVNDFMDEVDQKIEQQRDEIDDTYEEDSDEDDVNIDIDCLSSNKVDMIPAEDRSTHFVAIRITDKEILENIVKVQEDIIKSEEILRDCCMKKELFHITLSMLHIEGPEGISEAVQFTNDLRDDLADILKDKEKSRINIEGLDTFGHRVVYAKVKPVDDETFWTLINTIRSKLNELSDKVKVTNSFDFIPHLTVAKVSRPITKLRNSKYIDQAYYAKHTQANFGSQMMDNVQLCVIDPTCRQDGFYSTLAEQSVSL